MFDEYICKQTNLSERAVHFRPWGGSLINLLISDKAHMPEVKARDVELTNIYDMSTNNWYPNNHLTNTVGESKSVTDRHRVWRTDSHCRLISSYSELKIRHIKRKIIPIVNTADCTLFATNRTKRLFAFTRNSVVKFWHGKIGIWVVGRQVIH